MVGMQGMLVVCYRCGLDATTGAVVKEASYLAMVLALAGARQLISHNASAVHVRFGCDRLSHGAHTGDQVGGASSAKFAPL